jgi:GNAT superfamily N-acetyltransferase
MIEVNYARPEEREEIAQFMNDVFVRAKWDIEGWRRLLAGRWCGPEGRYAIAVRDAGRLIGVLGLVYADRMTAQGVRTTADMTSWYVLKEYRGQGIGQKMIALATSDPSVTVTNFSSAKAAVNVLIKSGLTVLDKERLVWHPRPVPAGYALHEDPLSLGDRLAQKDRKIIADHQGLRLRHLAVDTPDGLVAMVVYPQKKHDEFVTHEIMYLGDQALFAGSQVRGRRYRLRRSAGICDGALLPAGPVGPIRDRHALFRMRLAQYQDPLGRRSPFALIAPAAKAFPFARRCQSGRNRSPQDRCECEHCGAAAMTSCNKARQFSRNCISNMAF